MDKKEAEIVNEDFIARDDVYNIKLGGNGGWDYSNAQHKAINIQNQKVDAKMRAMHIKEGLKSMTDEKHDMMCKNISSAMVKHYMTHPGSFAGKHHSLETKQKIAEASKRHQSGKGNSQYGTMWICNDKTHESKKILKSGHIPNGWRKGRFNH